MFFAIAGLIFLDQITKAYFASRDFFFLGIHFHPLQNSALPFGLDFGSQVNFIILFFAYTILGYVVTSKDMRYNNAWWGKVLFVAGASSNLVDRFMFGHVRDFIDLNLGFVFNMADMFIVVGLVLVLFSSSGKRGLASDDGGVEKPTELV